MERDRLGVQMVLPHEVHPRLCASRRQGVPGTTQTPSCWKSPIHTAQGTFPKGPVCHSVRDREASMRNICTGLLLLLRQ